MALKKDKKEKILAALEGTPYGLWVREVARKTGIDKSTCSRYLEAMANEIAFEYVGRSKVYRLKGK